MATFRKSIFIIIFSSLSLLFGCFETPNNGDQISKKDSLSEQINKSVENFNNRHVYKVLTSQIIDSASNDNLIQIVFDNLSEQLPADYTKEYKTFLTWSREQQAIYVIWNLEAEVNNGGFNQFYFNPSGQYAEAVPDALKLVGAKKLAELVLRVNTVFNDNKEKIIRHQDGTLDGFSKSYSDNPLNKFDEEYFELDKIVNLRQLQIDFIRNNKTKFIDK